MRRNNVGAEGTGWFIANLFKSISSARRTRWNFAKSVQFDVIGKIVWIVDGIAIGQVMFQSELIGGGVDLAEVADTIDCWTGM